MTDEGVDVIEAPALYPEHEKLALISEKSQAVGEFLEWVGYEHGAELGVYEGSKHWLSPLRLPINQLLAQFFEIDLGKLEAEKRDMLKQCRGEPVFRFAV